MGNKQIDYAQLMATVGRYIAQRNLSDVCVMEFEHGILIIGSALYDAGEDTRRRTETHVLSLDELQRMVKGGSHASS